MTPPPPEESMVAGDPTQRLLTALGRFQRQVARAEEGAPQDSWCNECINQLIIGIEIAHGEDWADVKEALTDTARILQTYEDANRADHCVHFLKDSYEILCLMVGDLIVGAVRSGVMRKWHERFERALDELSDAGLTLVDDESSGEPEAPSRTTGYDKPEASSEEIGFDDLIEEGAAETVPSSLFEASGAGPARGRAFASDPDDPFAPLDPDADASSGGTPFLGAATLHQAGKRAEDLPSLDELLGRPVSPEDDLDEEAEASRAPELSDDFTADGGAVEDVVDDKEAADYSEAPMTAESPEGEEPAAVTPGAESGELDFDHAPEEDLFTAASQRVTVAPAIEPEPAPAPAPAAAATPAPEPEPEPGTPEALLRTAQRAMAAGNVADAKVFALQLAANMARLEADQVQAQISLIEKDIEANSDAITAGELAVNEAEQRVRQLEEEAAQRQEEYDAKRQHVGTLREEVASVEGSVADLNRQIAELEARRDEEVKRLNACQVSLDDSLSEESRLQSELDSLHEEESGSRENLDGAREHVRSLQEAGAAHNSRLECTQSMLSARRKAVEDIEHTILQVAGPVEATQDASGNAESGAAE